METFLNEAGAVFSQSTGDCCWLSCGEGRQEGLSLTTFGGGGFCLKNDTAGLEEGVEMPIDTQNCRNSLVLI